MTLFAAALLLASAEPTVVTDRAALTRLRNNSGLTLQWIDWDRRGRVRVSENGGVIHLAGSQGAAGGRGRLELDGDVVSIGATSFTFRGRIVIIDTPDPGRNACATGSMSSASPRTGATGGCSRWSSATV